MAATETLGIKFEAKGAKNLQNAINGIKIATLGLTQSQAKYEQAIRRLNTRQKKVVDGMFAIQTSTRNMGNAFSVLRSKMLLISFAFLIVGRSFGRLVTAASDLEEMMSKATVVFGKNMKVVREWATVLGNTVGRATSEIVEMATALQDTFVPLGFTREASTELATSLTKLAIDVASFNNQLDSQVANDFQSAIVGNHRTVAKYGIVITQSRLKLEALTIGLVKGNQELTAQQKVLARVSLIRKGTTDAELDAIKTAGSFENQMKALNAELLESAQFFGDLIVSVLQADLAFGIAGTSIVDFTKHMARKETLIGYASASLLVGAAFLSTHWKAIKLSKGIVFLGKAMTRTFFGAATAIFILAELIGYIVKAVWATEEETKSLKTLEEAMADAADASGLLAAGDEAYYEQVSKSIVALEKKLKTLKAVTEVEIYQASVTHTLTSEEKLLLIEIRKEQREYDNLKKVKTAIAALNRKDLRFQIDEQKKIASYMEDHINDLRTQLLLTNANNVAMAKTAKEAEVANVRMIETFFTVFTDTSSGVLNTVKEMKVALETMLEGTGLLEDIDLDNLDTDLVNQLAMDIFKAENAAGLLLLKIFNLEDKLKDEKVWSKFADSFSGAVDLIDSDIGLMSELMESLSETSLKVAAGAKDAWGDFAAVIGSAFISAAQSAIQANIDMARAQGEAEMATLKSSRRYQKASRKQQEAEEKKVKDTANKEIRKEFANQKLLNKAAATMDYASAVMTISKQTGIFSAPWIAALTVLWGAQMELINSQKAPTMKYGGLVGGSPHSQGGTMINAERGEFVVNKGAVDAIGIETLNRINEGQGGGGTYNISFSGNVLSKDFIEDEAIPQIKEALRRGGDIGIG